MHTFTQKPAIPPSASSGARSKSRDDKNAIRDFPRTIRNQMGSPLLPEVDLSQIPVNPPRARAIQAKLAINNPGDEYEREADSVADQVMHMPESQVQRACACGGKCPTCRKEQQSQGGVPLTAGHSHSGDIGQAVAPPIVEDALATPGQSLDPATRVFMEQRFNRDFSTVRVHSGTAASDSARAIQARAYTVGSDIVFGAGEYAPATPVGKRLLAHELTHVVQQNTAIQRQVVQRDLLFGDRNCSAMTSLPIHESASVDRGVYHTRTFSRPTSGRVSISVSARSDDRNCTFGVNVWQCHILADEPLEDQHIEDVGGTISYTLPLPTEEWNTNDKFALRIRVNCSATVDVNINPA